MYNIRSFYNLSDMTIEKLDGTSPRLYTLVAPLVMRRSVLRQNNNYPFWTSRAHTWFVAWEGETVFGFMPVEITRTAECQDQQLLRFGDDPAAAVALPGAKSSDTTTATIRYVP